MVRTAKRIEIRCLLLIGVISFAAILIASNLDAEEFDRLEDAIPDSPPAVVSDQGPDQAAEVATELLRLQEHMGGSVVKSRKGLRGWNYQPQPSGHDEAPKWTAYPPKTMDQIRMPTVNKPRNHIEELRAAAWQLDTTAHRLEQLDLYEQADALRNVATRLRHDARKMKQQAATDKQSTFEPPSRS